MQSTPNSLSSDDTSVTSRDVKGIGLINTSLKFSLEIGDNNINLLQSVLSTTLLFGGGGRGVFGKRRIVNGSLLNSLRNPLLLPDQLGGTLDSIFKDSVLGSMEGEMSIKFNGTRVTPLNVLRDGKGVDLDSKSGRDQSNGSDDRSNDGLHFFFQSKE
jgi:hypothetical protein